MKIIKLIFSKFFLSAILFLIQIALIWLLISIFRTYYLVFHVVCDVLAFVVFLSIVNRRETPEYKLPWLFLTLSFSVFGTFLYIMFSKHRMKRKERKMLALIDENTAELTAASKETESIVSDYLGDRAGVGNYLRRASRHNGHLGNRVTYFKVGEELWQDLLAELEKAEHFIFMEYFIIARGKMWNSIHGILARKAKEGVEVRLLYDDIGTLTTLRNGYYRKLRKEGINCCKFNTFKPIVSGIYNNRDHRKITVIDGKVGFTGGVNLGDEYINEEHRFGHWKDTGIKIEGSAVAELTAMFLRTFDMTTRHLSDYHTYLGVQTQVFGDEGLVHPFGDGPKPYYAEQVGENNYINLINGAHRYVWITTPYLILDHNLTTALRNAAMRGVDVRIVTPHIPDKKIVFNMTRSNYPYLMEAGVHIYEYTPGFIHAKMLVSDDEIAFVGTINLDYRSLTHHYECGAVLYKTPCIAEIKIDFESVFEVSQAIDPKTFKRSRPARLFNALLHLFAPMF